MRQPQDPTSSIRWLPFRSESSEPIPPFAVMRTTGFDEATGYYTVNQPNADSLSQVLINGASCVPALGEGQCHRTEPATVLYETNGGTPASDDDYGTQSGSWKLHAGKKGFRVLGVSTESNVAEFTFLGVAFKELNEAGGRRPVRAATTANITLSGAQTIDGVSIVAGEDVLVKNQTTTANNGIYTAASSTWARRADADSWDELVGALVVVTEGTTLADTLWMCTSNAGGTLGSTAVTWSKVYPLSSSLAVRDLEYAGSGVNITGCTAITFDADPGVPHDHPFTVTAGGSGEALIGMHEAGTLHAGVVTRYDQTMGLGVKTFSDDIIVNGAVFVTHTTVGRTQISGASGVTYIYTNVEATGDKYLSLTMGDDSPGNPPICIFGVNNVFGGSVSYPSGTIPCFAVYDSDLNLWRGATSTVSGLVFKGGLYTSGSLSVTVSAGDVTGLDEAIDDRVAALLVAGAGISLTYNDGAGTLTISCTITQYTDEMARDAIGTALTAGTGIAITPNDGADTITVALSFLGLEALTDPGADRILFWDDSAGAFTWLTLGSGLSITTTTLTATGSITGPGSSTDNAIVRWDGTGGTAIQNSTALVNDDGSLEVNATVAATSTASTEILHLHTLSTGTPANGFGSAIVVHLESSTTDDERAASWVTSWVDATHASRKSRCIWNVSDAGGGREVMRGEASGSAPMVGFLGASAAIRQTGDVGTAMVTFGLMSGTPTFAWGNLSSIPTASDTASGIVELAVQSEMETATDTTRAVVPGRVQYHPGVCKGWVHFSATGGTVTSLASHNVSSITDGGVGNYTINWNTDFSGTAYAVVGTASYVDGSATDVFIETHISFAAGSTQVYALSYDAGTLTDTTRISIVAFGDQA